MPFLWRSNSRESGQIDVKLLTHPPRTCFNAGGALKSTDSDGAVKPESVDGEGFLLTPSLAIGYRRLYRV